MPKRLTKQIVKGVFAGLASVSGSVMATASLTFAGRPQDESLRIAKGLKRRDPELLDQLIVQHQRRLLHYLLYLTGNRETASDLFQETWIRVLTRGAQFNGSSRFETWLFTIARNLVIDLRRKRTMTSLEGLWEDEDYTVAVPAHDPSPFESYASEENRRRVAGALLSLAPLHREVLVLRFHEELSLEEIAQITRAPLSTVKSRLYRGLAALRPLVAEVGRTAAPTGGLLR